MNEDKKEYTLDDLEDIIREYSTRLPKKQEIDPSLGDTRPVGQTGGNTAPGTSCDTHRWGDTRPIDGGRAPKPQDTRPMPDLDDDVHVYQPSKAKKPAAEPYTANWEPEYDAPMGKYTPKEPIEFPQKNRQQVIREKLAAGPEQRYQKLAKTGVSRLRAEMLLSIILFLAAASMALLYHQVDGQRLKVMICGQVLILLLSALVGYQRLLDGVMGILCRRFDLDGFLVVTLVVCWIDGLLCIKVSTCRLRRYFLFKC